MRLSGQEGRGEEGVLSVCTTSQKEMLTQTGKGLILEHMTCSAAHFTVPMVTAGFLAALLKSLRQVWAAQIHTHTYKKYFKKKKWRGGMNKLLFFPLTLPVWVSIYTQMRAHSRSPKEQTWLWLYGVVLILAHVKISPQSPPLPLIYYYAQHWSLHCVQDCLSEGGWQKCALQSRSVWLWGLKVIF